MNFFRQKDPAKLPHRLDYFTVHHAGHLNGVSSDYDVSERIEKDEAEFKATKDKRGFAAKIWQEFNEAVPTLQQVTIIEALEDDYPLEFTARKILGKDTEFAAAVGDWDTDNKQLFFIDSTKYERLDCDLYLDEHDSYTGLFKLSDEQSLEFNKQLVELDLDTGAQEEIHTMEHNNLLLVYSRFVNIESDDEDAGYIEFTFFADSVGFRPHVETNGDPELRLEKAPISYFFQIDTKPFKITDKTPQRRTWLVWPVSAVCMTRMPRKKMDIKQVLNWINS